MRMSDDVKLSHVCEVVIVHYVTRSKMYVQGCVVRVCIPIIMWGEGDHRRRLQSCWCCVGV